MIYWMTGLSGAGKTTIARGVAQRLMVDVLDGDNLRKGMCSNLGFSIDDRMENLRRIAHLARHLSKYTDVVVSCITPLESIRDMVKSICGAVDTIYVKASVEECIKRDPKNLYARMKSGEISGVTGIDSPYEPPVDADLVIDTEKMTKEESIDSMCRHISKTKKNDRFALYIGRWQPFHKGHEYIIRQGLSNGAKVAVAIRDCPVSDENPFSLPLILECIKRTFQEEVERGDVVAFPLVDIASVNIGRKVGYDVNTVDVPENIVTISGTDIRNRIASKQSLAEYVPPAVCEVLKEWGIVD